VPNLCKGLIVFFIAVTGVCSVYADEMDWRFWQKPLTPQIQTEEINKNPVIKEIQVTATLPDYPWVKVSAYKNHQVERCITCHDGIANVSPSHPPEFGCSVCHGGEPESLDKEQAHATLIYDPKAKTGKRNPSSLSVVEKSCGQLYCHAGHANEDRNHVARVKKSMMNTLAGVISGLRYQWAGQSQKTARYGTIAIADKDGSVPHHQGALDQLEQIPFFAPTSIPESDSRLLVPVSRHPADQVLRQQCFQCHVDSPPAKGQYRSQGCAACHFEYSSSGLYEGNDLSISRTDPGHARFHKIRAIPSRATCVKCHRSFELQALGSPAEQRQTLQQEETTLTIPPSVADPEVPPIETDNELSTVQTSEITSGETGQGTISSSVDVQMSPFIGKGQTKKDVHTKRGMDCTDCHTQLDIMGDGNLYSKQHEAVEIRCETCHGDSESHPYISKITDPEDSAIRVSKHYKNGSNKIGDWMAVSSRNRKMTNVKVQNGRLVTIGKQTGEVHEIPLLKDSLGAHSIPQHQSRLECSACHARWVVRCPQCHQSFTKSQNSLPTPHSLDIGEPALMIGPRGKVAPMLIQPKRHLTVLDEKKNPIPVLGPMGEERGHFRQWAFTNPHGTSGSNLAYALNPHSIQKQVRSCASCHLSSKTLGLGEGDIKIGKNFTGKNDFVEPVNRSDIMRKASQFEPKAKVSMRGESLAGTHQLKARTFNQKEINRILRVGNCIPCHDTYGDPVYKDIKSSYQFASTLNHRQLRDKMLSLRQTSE
jgi:hypothetical protein